MPMTQKKPATPSPLLKPAAKQYEHLTMSIETLDLNETLQAYGRAGWRLVSSTLGGYDSGRVWRSIGWHTVTLQRLKAPEAL